MRDVGDCGQHGLLLCFPSQSNWSLTVNPCRLRLTPTALVHLVSVILVLLLACHCRCFKIFVWQLGRTLLRASRMDWPHSRVICRTLCLPHTVLNNACMTPCRPSSRPGQVFCWCGTGAPAHPPRPAWLPAGQLSGAHVERPAGQRLRRRGPRVHPAAVLPGAAGAGQRLCGHTAPVAHQPFRWAAPLRRMP
jgi:hypothetical protein